MRFYGKWLFGSWILLELGATDGVVTDDRVGVLKTTGLLRAKTNIYNSWSDLEYSVTSFAMSRERIGVLINSGVYKVKEGAISSSWYDVQVNTGGGALGHFLY